MSAQVENTVKKYTDKFGREEENQTQKIENVTVLGPDLHDSAQNIVWPEAIRERAKDFSYKSLQMELAPSLKY